MKKYIHLPCSAILTWISPAFPDEQLLFIHKVTGSTKAWRHLHLTSCRLTYVNLSHTRARTHIHTHADAHTLKHLTLSCHTPTPVSNPLHHNDFQGCNAQYILAPSTFVFATLFWEDSYAEVLVSMESISSNHSKRDYEVNFLYSHLG